MNKVHELIDEDLPAYITYQILSAVRRLKEVEPNHTFVRAIEEALPEYLNERRQVKDQLALF